MSSFQNQDYLSDEKEHCLCVIEMERGNYWFPVGLLEVQDGANDREEAHRIAQELAQRGRLTCIDPSMSWTFIAIDITSGPFRVRPFTFGKRSAAYVEKKFAALKQTAAEHLEALRGRRGIR